MNTMNYALGLGKTAIKHFLNVDAETVDSLLLQGKLMGLAAFGIALEYQDKVSSLHLMSNAAHWFHHAIGGMLSKG